MNRKDGFQTTENDEAPDPPVPEGKDSREVICTLAIADCLYPNGLKFTKDALREAAKSDPRLRFSEETGTLDCEMLAGELLDWEEGKKVLDLKWPFCPPGPVESLEVRFIEIDQYCASGADL